VPDSLTAFPTLIGSAFGLGIRHHHQQGQA
jgi:hypothetical protein